MTGMPIQIRNPDVVRDIRALAERLGLPMTEVVADAVRRRLQEELGKASDAQAAAQRRVADVLARIDALAVTGPVLTDDDLYGPDGLPR
ncbi:MAG: type II toxin-antitoxin system VapB family antitoxin [Hyphomonadaceae bacterium]